MQEDKIVQELTEKFNKRSEVGIMKYGVTLDRKDLTLSEWLNHLLEEQMDACLYTLKAINELKDYETERNHIKQT